MTEMPINLFVRRSTKEVVTTHPRWGKEVSYRDNYEFLFLIGGSEITIFETLADGFYEACVLFSQRLIRG